MKKKILLVCLCYVCVMFVNAQELEKGVQNAVNRLADQLSTRWDVEIDSLTLQDGTTTSLFSLQLQNLVSHYATNTPLFNVIERKRSPVSLRNPSDPPKGTIKGIFTESGNKVEVFLYLVSDSNQTRLGSHRFTFPRAEIPENALVPENKKEVDEREQIFAELSKPAAGTPAQPSVNTQSVFTAPANQSIHIEAYFNSASMTYFHNDELQITVWADRNCWFKVIHIDVNNQMKMVYPNNSDRDNYLGANTSRNIFETLGWRTVEPYGAETILVVASSQQFANIEQEYHVPQKPVTADALRAALGESRGTESFQKTPITFSGEGTAKYTITVLKPDEEYEYTKPENMTEFFQSLRDDIRRRGGTFSPDSNDKSGSYVIDGFRGSYRVPNNRPDIIQFASYDLDAYAAIALRGTPTRGTPYNFSFERPQDIAWAVQQVRSSILEKGGTFTGNEQQGSFRSKGIAGQYRVADVVNVTISEKPIVVPNSLIETEVKKYFGVR